MSNRLIIAGLGLMLVAAGGCQNKSNNSAGNLSKGTAVKSPTTQYTPMPDAALRREQAVAAENSAAVAAAMAERIQNVTQNLEPLVDKRNHPSASGVQWDDAYSMRLTDGPRAGTAGHGGVDATGQSHVANGNGPEVAKAAPAAYVATPKPTVTATAMAMPAGAAAEGWEQKIVQRARDYPHDTAAQLDYQLLMFLQDEQVPQLEAMTSLQKEDREIMSATLDGLSNFRMVLRADENAMLSRKVQPLLELADRLRAQAELTIAKVALCTKVDGFGRYEPIEPMRFVAGKENPAILYCEVENFSSQQQGDEQHMWVTRLQEQATLYTDGGLAVWDDQGGAKGNAKEIVDLSRNRRHDFCLAKRINLPGTLGVGRYVLKITIIDQQAHRIAEATVGVQVVTQ